LRWWHGGALRYYLQFKADNPSMRYFDGDFKNYDMKVHRTLMELYCVMGGVYFDFTMHTPESQAYRILLSVVMKWLTQRLTHVFGDIWKMIIGCMPSGAWDTSHGDSWIAGFLFWWYFEVVYEANPSRRRQMDALFASGHVEFACYGDDHNGGVHHLLHDIINENGYAQFVLSCVGMEIKDIRNNIPFLSEPDWAGGMSTRGVVFLQRYFVTRPPHFPASTARIVPYRPITKYYWKLPFGSGGIRTPIDFLLSAAGNAYDSMGTNLIAYEFLRHVYFSVALAEGLSTKKIREHYEARMHDPKEKDFNKLMRKADISMEDLLSGFPSMERLQSLHIVDDRYLQDEDDASEMYQYV